jgi:hypothetical protein
MEIYILAEGQTEERFIKDILAPSFRANRVFIKPILLPTSKGHSGGAVNFDRFLRNVRNTLKQYPDWYCVVSVVCFVFLLDIGTVSSVWYVLFFY